MSQHAFTLTQAQLRQIIADVLAHAKSLGASAAEAKVSEGVGQTVTVRHDEVETIQYNRDKGIGITVYLGQRRGNASTSDLSPQALRATTEAALSIARFTAEDPASGLADPALLSKQGDAAGLDLCHPWAITVDDAVETARACEAAAIAVDKRISNSEGATVWTEVSQFAYGNSHGFIGGYPTSQHSISCSVIAGEGDAMQRDSWDTWTCDPVDLEAAASVGRKAGERTVARLGSRKIATTQAPILYESMVAGSLASHFISAVSGGSLYRKSSFLPDSVGQQVFSEFVTITDDPAIPKGLASSPFDEEGVATVRREVVSKGVVQGYFLGSYSARKLNLRTTGNAGGNHNIVISPTAGNLEALLKQMGRGFLVTELMGSGVNGVTGDYSRGAAGFWIEDGTIAYPVQEVTIAGNLKDIYRGIVAVGSDVIIRGGRRSGSILVDNMTIAGD
jgi:PmbA protein